MECSGEMNRDTSNDADQTSIRSVVIPFSSGMEELVQVTAAAMASSSSSSSSQSDGTPVVAIMDDEEEEEEEEEENGACVNTCWDLVKSLYLPLLIQSVFGGFHIFRSLILGNFIHLQLEGIVVAKKSSSSTSRSSHWPPPALIGLSILTVVALIVHPDGYTWIFLRKVRHGFFALLRASTDMWTLAVNDHGATISTLLALATFCSLFFVVYVLHKTLSPKTPQHKQRQKQTEKQKRKKRKNVHVNVRAKGNSRIRASSNNPSGTPKEDHEIHSFSSATDQQMPSLPPLVEDEPVSIPPLSPSNVDHMNQRPESPPRSRTFSVSTMDSTTSSTCSTTSSSGRSSPTTASTVEPELQRQFEPASHHTKGTDTLQSVAIQSRNQIRRAQKNTRVKKPLPVNNVPGQRNVTPSATPSKRWDALKPSNRNSAQNIRRGQRQQVTPHNRNTVAHEHQKPKSRSSKRYESAHQPSIRHSTVSPDVQMCKSFTQGKPMNVYESHQDPKSSSWLSSHLTSSDPSVQRLSEKSQFSSPTRLMTTSSLNAESPSWVQRSLQSTPIRPPPGLEAASARNDVPYGCSSSDIGSPPPSPLQGLSKQWNGSVTESMGSLSPASFLTAVESPLLSKYQSSALPLEAGDALRLPFRTDTGLFAPPSMSFRSHPHVKENPFASSDGEDDEEQIEAELQELGGRMVGSILDF